MKAVFIGVASLILLSGCGERVCVGGIGDCHGIAFTQTQSGAPGGPLLIKAPSHKVSAGGTIKITASGGTPPYWFERTEGPGSIDRDTGVYLAPTQTSDVVVIRVNDNAPRPNKDEIAILIR